MQEESGEQKPVKVRKRDPLKYLLSVMNDPKAKAELRVRAAIAAAQYIHVKKGEGGKKDERQEAAEKAAGGRFKPTRAPKLVVAGGKLVDGVP